ncbi:MAG: hypothetical protein U0939_00210 [Pirellulales bacterium]
MPSISFALLENENLKQYGRLKIKQAEVIVEVTGNTDSSTLAKIREAAWERLEPSRANLNKALKLQCKKIEAASKKNESQVELKKELEKKLGAAVDLLEKQFKAEVKKAIIADQALAMMVLRDGLKFGVRTTWSLANLVWDTTEAVVSVGAAATVVGGLNAIRKCYAVIKDVQKILDEFNNNSLEEEEHRKQLKAALKKVSSVKKGASIPTGDYNNLERLALSYPPKIAAVELSSKELAKCLDALLDETEGIEFPNKKTQQNIEAETSKLINKIIHINQYSKSGKELVVKSKDMLKDLKKSKDTGYILGIVDTFLEYVGKVDPLMELDNLVGLMVGGLNQTSDYLLEAEKDFE